MSDRTIPYIMDVIIDTWIAASRVVGNQGPSVKFYITQYTVFNMVLTHKQHFGILGAEQSKFLSCYCCLEICPHGAITMKTPMLGRLVRPFIGVAEDEHRDGTG